jgi:hypothetical protein
MRIGLCEEIAMTMANATVKTNVMYNQWSAQQTNANFQPRVTERPEHVDATLCLRNVGLPAQSTANLAYVMAKAHQMGLLACSQTLVRMYNARVQQASVVAHHIVKEAHVKKAPLPPGSVATMAR